MTFRATVVSTNPCWGIRVTVVQPGEGQDPATVVVDIGTDALTTDLVADHELVPSLFLPDGVATALLDVLARHYGAARLDRLIEAVTRR